MPRVLLSFAQNLSHNKPFWPFLDNRKMAAKTGTGFSSGLLVGEYFFALPELLSASYPRRSIEIAALYDGFVLLSHFVF